MQTLKRMIPSFTGMRACIKPLQIRTKGQFKSLSHIFKWISQVYISTEGRGRSKSESLVEKLRQCIGELKVFKSIASKVYEDIQSVDDVLKLLKTS